MKKKTFFSGSQCNCGRLLSAVGYIAFAAAVLSSSLYLTLRGKAEPGGKEEVSASHVTVSRTDVHQAFFAGGSTTVSAGASDATVSEASKAVKKPKDNDFVRVAAYVPDIQVELKYASEGNFTGHRIYDFTDAWLRYGTVQKLASAQEKLKKQGVGLKIWDAFRPVSAQYKLWKICPDARYVANPNKGFSSHSRGNTVDVTLVDEDGNEAAMPTGFDDFSRLADRDYSDVKDKEAVANAKLLEKTMKDCGFVPYSVEWWHFSDSVKYGVAKEFTPE